MELTFCNVRKISGPLEATEGNNKTLLSVLYLGTIVLDPTKRLTSWECLTHPFFKDVRKGDPPAKVQPPVHLNHSSSSTESAIDPLLAKFIIRCKATFADAKTAFNAFTKDERGRVGRRDFKRFLKKKIRLKMKDEDRKKLRKLLDPKNNKV